MDYFKKRTKIFHLVNGSSVEGVSQAQRIIQKFCTFIFEAPSKGQQRRIYHLLSSNFTR